MIISECKLFVLDKNTWNYTTEYKLFVLDKNTWKYTSENKLFVLDKSTWYDKISGQKRSEETTT